MHKYFMPNTVAIFNKPETPAKPVDEPAPERTEIAPAQKTYLERNYKQQDIYYKEYIVHGHKKKD